MFKKIFALVFAAALFLLPVSCGEGGTAGGGGSPDPEQPSGPQQPSGPEEPVNYQGYFKKMTMTEGDLLVFNRCEALSTAQLFFAESVQGLFAQAGESKYYRQAGGAYDTWLNELEANYGKHNRDVTLDDMRTDFLARFSGGYVLFDRENEQSVNCARTVAGAKQLAMVDVSLKEWADANGMTEQVDVRNMTARECFDTYRDDLDNTGLVQQRGTLVDLTDYAIACKYFCYYLPGTKRDVLKLRNDVQKWCEGCAVYGWCPNDEGTDVAFSSTYGSFTLASDYCRNMTVFSCTDFFGEEEFIQPNEPCEREYPTNKHYITIVNSDGDNLQCWYGGTFDQSKYMGASRGRFPMGWSVSPALYSLAPNILRHTYNNAKAGDTFVCSVSGLGYTYPLTYPEEQLKRFTSILDEYLEKCDLSVVKILDNGLNERVIEAYSKMEHAEGFLYCTYQDCYVGDAGRVRWSENGKPFVACRATMWNSSPEAIASQINSYPADATSIDGYTYVNLHVWSMDYPQVKEMVEKLNENVVVVDPVTFLRLIKKNVPHEDAIPGSEI